MFWEAMFERFSKVSPVTVMARATLEYALAPEWINDLFERTAEAQYTRTLTLSTLVDLMFPVVCGVHKSVRSAYLKSAADIGASLAAVYAKLTGLETNVSEALVRELSARLADAINAMPGGVREALVPGYRTRILDGNCLGATEHRIAELREIAAGPLPGKSLVVLDPERMLILDMIACEDGHAQERSLLDRVLETIEAGQLWVADRNFCTAGFLRGIDRRRGAFVIRHHRGMVYEECGPWSESGMSDTGYVMERTVRFVDDQGQWFMLRLVRVRLNDKTRDGDEYLLLLTNLPVEAADAKTIATVYRQRWSLETAFLHLTETLRCEIETLGYPKAALFAFAVAVLSYNVLAVERAALRSVHGQQKGDDELSLYHLTDDIVGTYRGMEIALPDTAWRKFRDYSAEQLAVELLGLARDVDLRRYRKAKRGPKKPPPPRFKATNKPHVSTKRLLNARKTKETTP